MAHFLKFKFLIILKLNFKGGQFYKKCQYFVFTKNCKFCSKIKFEIGNGDFFFFFFFFSPGTLYFKVDLVPGLLSYCPPPVPFQSPSHIGG